MDSTPLYFYPIDLSVYEMAYFVTFCPYDQIIYREYTDKKSKMLYVNVLYIHNTTARIHIYTGT